MTHKPQHPAHPIPGAPIDLQIEHTLAALRNAQPRAGVDAMNRRLLAGLQQQAQSPAAEPAHRLVFPWRLSHLALPAMTALLIATTWLLSRSLPHATATHQAHVQLRPAATFSAVRVTTTTSNLTPAKLRVPHISLLRCGPATTPCTRESATTPAEQALLDDLHAPSQPAPTLPLTRDERLLVQAARQSEQIELAQLEAPPRPAPRRPSIAEYVHRMLAPLVAAESIEPTQANDNADANQAPPDD